MLTVGKHKAHLYHGDQHPASLYLGNKLITGYKITKASGTGRVAFTAPYKAALPSVTVHGEGKQDKLEGKNLLDVKDISIDGPVTQGFNTNIQKPITISLKSENVKVTKNIWRVEVRYSDGSKSYIVDPKTVKTFNATPNKSINLITFRNTYMEVGRFTDIQVEYGGTATPYEPYCGGIPAPNPQYPIEPVFLEGASVVGRGKNLVGPDDIQYRYPVPGHPGEFGEMRIFGNGFTVLPNIQYTVLSSTSEPGAGIVVVDIDTGNILASIYSENRLDFTPKEMYRVYIYHYLGDSITKSDTLKLTIGEPSDEPYIDLGTAPLPILRATKDGKYRDAHNTITGVTDRKLKRLVLDGTEPWVQTGAVSDEYRGYALSSEAYNALRDNVEGFSNSLIYNNKENKPNGFCQNSSLYGLRVVISRAIVPNGTLKEWKDYLAKRFTDGKPIDITYVLDTPETESSDPAILRQHPGYTQLIQQGGEMQAVIDAEYYKEMP